MIQVGSSSTLEEPSWAKFFFAGQVFLLQEDGAGKMIQV